MTGLLLMADSSGGISTSPLILRSSNQGQREQAEATIVLLLPAVDFLKTVGVSSEVAFEEQIMNEHPAYPGQRNI